MAQNLETGLIINKLTGDTVGLNVQNSDALINDVTVGKGNLVGFGNTVVGQSAMTGTTHFQYSTAIGYQSLKDNQSSNNTAIGSLSLSKNATGVDSLAIGVNSLENNTTGNLNIAIGNFSLNKTTNVSGNLAIGHESLNHLTGGTRNVILGNNFKNIQMTSDNTVVGYGILPECLVGDENTILGSNVLFKSTASTENTLIGFRSMFEGIDTIRNTALGSKTLGNNKYGNNNTAIGYSSLDKLNSGDNNTALGYSSGPTYSALTNTTCLGANSTVTKDNSVILGSPSDTNIMVGIGTSAPDDSAKLQVDSTTKGFLPPRMTGSQAEAISNPAEGLMVYVTNGNGSTIISKGWWGTTGTTSSDWVKIGP